MQDPTRSATQPASAVNAGQAVGQSNCGIRKAPYIPSPRGWAAARSALSGFTYRRSVRNQQKLLKGAVELGSAFFEHKAKLLPGNYPQIIKAQVSRPRNKENP